MSSTTRFTEFEEWLTEARGDYDGPEGTDDWLDDGNDAAWEAFSYGLDSLEYAEQVLEFRLESGDGE